MAGRFGLVGGVFAEPSFDDVAMKPPMLADFLAGDLAFLDEFVERRFGNLQIGRQFVDRENVVELGWHGVAIRVRAYLAPTRGREPRNMAFSTLLAATVN